MTSLNGPTIPPGGLLLKGEGRKIGIKAAGENRMREVLLPDPCGPNDGPNAAPCEVGTDHVAAGVGMRHRNKGTINLTGAPPNAEPLVAYVYWGIIASSTDPPPGLGQITFEGRLLNGHPMETCDGPCWGEDQSFYAFRADVTSLLAHGINGEYGIGLAAEMVADGQGSWDKPHSSRSVPLHEGASLVVIFTHPDLPDHARTYLHEQSIFVGGSTLIQHALAEPLPTEGKSIRHTRLGGDGQTHAEGNPVQLITTSLGELRVSEADLTPIRGPGSEIDPHSDWQGQDATDRTRLWDTQTSHFSMSFTNLKQGGRGYDILYSPQAALVPDSAAGGLLRKGYPTTPPGPGSFDVLWDCVVPVAHVMTVH